MEHGKIHTYTDMNSASSGDTIGVRTASNIHVTVQNLNVVGKNYYGLIYVPDSTSQQNVVVTYKNITYNGPQITYHPRGLSIYKDLKINIIDSTACVANEVAETSKLQIGGNTTITHNSVGNSAFWFRGTSPYLEILEGAHVSITTTRDIAYTASYLQFTLNKNSTFDVKSKYGFFRDNSHQASSILLDKASSLTIIQTQTNGSNATISCRGDFTINEDSSLYIEANYKNTAPLILFNTSSSTFNLNNPKSVILYNSSYQCLSFANTSTFNIKCGKIDYWITSPNLITTGVLENNPLYSWNKSNEEVLDITATVTSSKTTITANNFTEAELQSLPDINLLSFQTAKTLRFVAFGNLELQNAPAIIEFQKPLISHNPLILGRKEETITFTVTDSRIISSNWYLYVSIDKPLSTADEKHTLPDSLVFIDDSNNIITLSNTPTLIYTGTGNDGNIKVTDIEWSKTSGILFKVINPIYNGESYSTLVNWILTDKIIDEDT